MDVLETLHGLFLRGLTPLYVVATIVVVKVVVPLMSYGENLATQFVFSKAIAEKKGIKPIGRLINWASVGCDPRIMGIGPAPAIRKLMERAEFKLGDIDLFEVNEAFAPQYLAVEKELGLPRDRTNVDGGAIALGHPLGGTGAVLLTKALHELERTDGTTALITMCCGGGLGTGTIIERI